MTITATEISHYNSPHAGKAGYTPSVPGKIGAPAGLVANLHPKNETATSLSAQLAAQAAGNASPVAASEKHHTATIGTKIDAKA